MAEKKTDTKKKASGKSGTKKASVKKSAVKKTAAGKTAARKPVSKKNVAAKAPVKKAAVKKAVTGKTAVKKTATKKAVVKKTPAKKPVVKKAAVKTPAGQAPSVKAEKEFIVKSIFMIHVRRIGWIRTTLGGFLMYPSFLEFVFLHLTAIVVLYQWMMVPFFRIKKFNMKDYILLDRGKVEGMMAFDRLNCEFCGYANGTAKLWNDQLDVLEKADFRKGGIFYGIIAGIYGVILAVFLLICFIFSKILFALIALFLGFHWAGNREAMRALVKSGYAGSHSFLMRWMLRFAKLSAGTLLTNLEQIESSWCPLKHIERRSAVNTDHHRNFIDRKNLADMYEILEKEGTVSPRKPRY